MNVSMVSVSRRAAPPHCGHFTLTNSGTFSSGERPVAGDLDARRQHHRQLLLRHRHHAALRAVDHRDRRAPVALPRDAPVLDAVRDGAPCRSPSRSAYAVIRRARLFARRGRDHSPEFSTMPYSVNGSFMPAPRASSPSTGRITGRIGDAVLAAEFEIALVVRRHRHDGARAVAHQHEVADPDRHLLAAERIDGVVPGEEAFLLDIARVAVGARVHHGLGAGLALRRPAASRSADARAPGSRRWRRRSCPRAW